MEFFLVGIGGFLGSITRYILSKIIPNKTDTFPINTFLINITGAILLGIVSTLPSHKLYSLFGDGFLGSYTTFSTFMFEGCTILKNNTVLNAFTYILTSIIVGIIGFIIGTHLI